MNTDNNKNKTTEKLTLIDLAVAKGYTREEAVQWIEFNNNYDTEELLTSGEDSIKTEEGWSNA